MAHSKHCSISAKTRINRLLDNTSHLNDQYLVDCNLLDRTHGTVHSKHCSKSAKTRIHRLLDNTSHLDGQYLVDCNLLDRTHGMAHSKHCSKSAKTRNNQITFLHCFSISDFCLLLRPLGKIVKVIVCLYYKQA